MEDVVMINVKGGATVKTVLLAIVAVLGLGSVAPVAAAPITGVLTIGGSVIVSATTIDWIPDEPFDGTFTTKIPDSGYFEGIASTNPFEPSGGQIVDLGPGNPPPVNGFLSNFVGATLPSEFDDLSFNLETVTVPGVEECVADFDYAEGDTCRLGFFLLTQNADSVTATLEVKGHFVDLTYGDDGSLNNASGEFTNTLKEVEFDTIREVVDIIDSPGGSIETGWSATFIATAVPEPATMLTFGLGTAVLAAHRRRRAKKNAQKI